MSPKLFGKVSTFFNKNNKSTKKFDGFFNLVNIDFSDLCTYAHKNFAKLAITSRKMSTDFQI